MKRWDLMVMAIAFTACAASVARGQAVVEYSVGVAKSGAATAAAGKAAGGVFGSVSKVLDVGKKGEQAATSSTGSAVVLVDPSKPAPPPAPVDPAAITQGLTRAEMVRKFGPPSMKVARSDGSRLLETCWYTDKDGEEVVVTLSDGKVSSVFPPPPVKPDPASSQPSSKPPETTAPPTS